MGALEILFIHFVLHPVILSIFIQHKLYVIILCLSFWGRSHVSSLFANEEQDKRARDVFDTVVTHAGFVYGVIDVVSCTQ